LACVAPPRLPLPFPGSSAAREKEGRKAAFGESRVERALPLAAQVDGPGAAARDAHIKTSRVGVGVALLPCGGRFGLGVLKFNFHLINIFLNAWSTKCRLIICMSAQIRSNLRDESIKPI
jgi:hypothetical protein